MRRLVYIGLAVALLPWLVIGLVNLGGEEDRDDHYFVRAVFDNASDMVEGEDVKVAGVPVGVVSGLEVTEDEKAALVLRIDDEDFTPWKADAECTIRPQSLIGEKFVDCQPGSASAEPLERLERGPGDGSGCCRWPARARRWTSTSSTTPLRLPYRQRFSILLSELGTGLAGRGKELNEVIHRANPALRETDRVLKILASQNRELADLARDSDAALGPLARERSRVGNWIVEADMAEASAERRSTSASASTACRPSSADCGH